MKSNTNIIRELNSFDEVLYYQIDVIKQNPKLHVFAPSMKLKQDIPYMEIDTQGYISLEEWIKTNSLTKNNIIEILDLYSNYLSKCDEYFLHLENFVPGFSGIYFSSDIDISLQLKDEIMLLYYPLSDIGNPSCDPLKILGEELIIYAENKSDIVFTQAQIDFLDNLSIHDMARQHENFMALFIKSDETIPDFGFLSYFKNMTGRIGKAAKAGLNNIRDFSSAFFGKDKSKNNLSGLIAPAHSNVILKDTFIIPSIVISEMILLLISFLILKNQMLFLNSILPVVIVTIFIIICLLMDLWLLFSDKSPLKIKPLFFRTKNKSTTGNNNYISENELNSIDIGKFSAKLTSHPSGSDEFKDCVKYLIATEDFLIGSDRIRVDLHLEYPFIDDMHARILCRQGVFFIEDSGSDSGTFLNDMRLKKHFEYRLENNSKIRFGNVVFYFSKNQ